MPTLTGTNKIKGVLDIGIKTQITSGQNVHVTTDEFYDHRVQTAIQMKLVTSEDSVALQDGDGNKVRIKNTYHNTLSIGEIIKNLLPGQVTVLDEEELRTPYVQAALSKKMLKIVGSMSPGDKKESTVKVGDVFGTNKPVIPSIEETTKPIQEEVLETNEEITGAPRVIEMDGPTEVVTDPNPAPVQKDAVSDPRKEAVVWNPANTEVIKQIPNAVIMRGKTPQTTGVQENDPDFMNKVADGELNPDGTPNPEFKSHSPMISPESPAADIIGFVDSEQEKERIAKHPKLSTKATDQNDEIDFIG